MLGYKSSHACKWRRCIRREAAHGRQLKEEVVCPRMKLTGK